MPVNYELLERQLDAMIDGENDLLAISANFVALLFAEIDNVNWLGLYIARGNELILGPFQGMPACAHLPLGHGVCGTAALENRTIRVDDVHQFEGHITCDSTSRSELVIPLVSNGKVIGVLDIDSPVEARFSTGDQSGCESLCRRLVGKLESVRTELQNFI